MTDEKLNLKLIPKEQWICDNCGEVIKSSNQGWLEWYKENGDNTTVKGFRIVHHDKKCMYNDRELYLQGKSTGDMHLDYFLGVDGLNVLLDFFDENRPEDNTELTEIIRRLHVDYYEEAKMYHQLAIADNFVEADSRTLPLQSTSIDIIKEYGDK